MKPETTIEPNVKQTVPFFWVMNIEESVRYYKDGLGFNMTEQWIEEGKLRWCRLERGGGTLMLQEFWKEGHHANVPDGKLGAGVSIYFICEDALSLYREFISHEVQASKPIVSNGMWMTSLTDPNGYKIVFESYTNAPADKEYSGAGA